MVWSGAQFFPILPLASQEIGDGAPLLRELYREHIVRFTGAYVLVRLDLV
jgi:hypothetical protein